MTSKLIPKDPSSTTTIRRVTPNITTLSAPFSRFGLIKVGGRATLIALPSGAVAVFSPVALTDEVRSVVRDMGTVKYIVAPDMLHHIFVTEWHREFPDARVVAPEGLKEKREKSGDNSVRFDSLIKAGQQQRLDKTVDAKPDAQTLTVDSEFDAEFDVEYVHAHSNKELVLNYKRERTLIQADLFFTLPAIEQYAKSSENPHAGLVTKLMNGMMGTTGGALTWQRRVIWYAIAENRKEFRESMKRIYAWDFDRVIPCHGDVVEKGGKGVFKSVMQWFLET